MRKKTTEPTIIFVYKDIYDGLPYRPKHSTIFNWIDQEEIVSSWDLLQMISENERKHPGSNIYIVGWENEIRSILPSYYDAIMSFVPEWLHPDIMDSYIPRQFEIVFQIMDGSTTSDVSPLRLRLEFLRLAILKRILPKI